MATTYVRVELPPSSELTTDEMLAKISAILPAAVSRDPALFNDSGEGELYFPTSWIRSLHKFARHRYHDDRRHNNRLPRQLPIEEQWVWCCRALGCNWKDGVQAKTRFEEVAVVYEAICAREGEVFVRDSENV